MIERLKRFFGGPPAAAPAPSEELRIALAVLLIEAARMDADYALEERRIVAAALRRHFALDDLETASLLAAAERVQERSVELSRFAASLREGYEPERRVAVIELLWEVAYADGAVHDYEANLLRRVGGLLFVPDAEAGAARRRVSRRLGLTLD